MHVQQIVLESLDELDELTPLSALNPQLVFVFGAVSLMADSAFSNALKTAFPLARIVGCSTAGEICQDGVNDDTMVVTAVHFENPSFTVHSTHLQGMEDSQAAGERLGQALIPSQPHSVFILAPGVSINGSALIEGLHAVLPETIRLSGGLAGDAGAFKQSWTLLDGQSDPNLVLAIGFSGDHLHLTHGCFGGWKPFGPARQVTRAEGNILYELDGERALDIYDRYLGDYAKDLPGSGLLFPFEMLTEAHEESGLVRSILGIDREAGSLILAGHIIQNGYLRLMHASTDALVDGAEVAASHIPENESTQQLALLVSCVGRKVVMGGRIDEEIEVVGDSLGRETVLTGFYSNGEISPVEGMLSCQLHNQTMTITCLSETLA